MRPLIGIALFAVAAGACTTTETDPVYGEAARIYKDVDAQPWISESKPAVAGLWELAHPGEPMPEEIYTLTQEPYKLLYTVPGVTHDLTTVLKNRRVVFNGVTGSGKTTECRFLAKLIAGDAARFREVKFDPHKTERDFVYDPATKTAGPFVEWLQRAAHDPSHHYVFFVDEVSAANPYEVFGQDVINLLENPDDTVHFDGVGDVRVPANFYLLSAMKTVGKDVHVLDDALLRRLGKEIRPAPDPVTFAKQLQGQDGIPDAHKIKLVYLFLKINSLIAERVGAGYQIGEWGSIKSVVEPGETEAFLEKWQGHLDAFPESKGKLPLDELRGLVAIADHGGTYQAAVLPRLEGGSLTFLRENIELLSTAFMVVGGAGGLYLARRRRRKLTRINASINQLMRTYPTDPGGVEKKLNAMIDELQELGVQGKMSSEELELLVNKINRFTLDASLKGRHAGLDSETRALIDEHVSDNVVTEEEMAAIKAKLAGHKDLSPEDEKDILEHLKKFIAGEAKKGS